MTECGYSRVRKLWCRYLALGRSRRRRSCSRWETNSALNPVAKWAATWDCGRVVISRAVMIHSWGSPKRAMCTYEACWSNVPTTSSGPSAQYSALRRWGLHHLAERGGKNTRKKALSGGGEGKLAVLLHKLWVQPSRLRSVLRTEWPPKLLLSSLSSSKIVAMDTAFDDCVAVLAHQRPVRKWQHRFSNGNGLRQRAHRALLDCV